MHMKPLPSYLWPSKIEMVVLFILGCILGTFPGITQALDIYGAQASWSVVLASVSGVVGRLLTWLDSLKITATVVTFIIWVVIGLIVVCIIEAFISVTRQVAYEAEYSSGKFFHPGHFSRLSFWRHVAIQSLATIAITGLLLALVFLSLVYILPIASTYASSFAFETGLNAPGYITLGLAVIFIDLFALDVCVRLFLHRNRAVA